MTIDIKTSGYEPSPDFGKYTKQKLTEVARRVPRSQRETATCSLKCMQRKGDDGDIKTCRIIVQFGGEEFRAKETTQHMYTALDIVVADVVQQIRIWRSRQREREEQTGDRA
jgi:ribosomal subunit interface protein